MPSYYPKNPIATENNSSYVINLESPSIPGVGTLISITDVYLVVTSDSLIDNQFTHVDNSKGISGLQGPNSFIDS